MVLGQTLCDILACFKARFVPTTYGSLPRHAKDRSAKRNVWTVLAPVRGRRRASLPQACIRQSSQDSSNWLSGKNPSTLVRCCLLTRKRNLCELAVGGVLHREHQRQRRRKHPTHLRWRFGVWRLGAWVGFWVEGLGFRAWSLKFGRRGLGDYRAGVAEAERVDQDERHA